MNYTAKALEWAGVSSLVIASYLYSGTASAVALVGFALILEAYEQSDDD